MAWKEILLQFSHFRSVFRAPFVSHATSQASISIKSVDKLYKPRISNLSVDLTLLNRVEKLGAKCLCFQQTQSSLWCQANTKSYSSSQSAAFSLSLSSLFQLRWIKKNARPLREIEKNLELLKAH